MDDPKVKEWNWTPFSKDNAINISFLFFICTRSQRAGERVGEACDGGIATIYNRKCQTLTPEHFMFSLLQVVMTQMLAS
jgi:hypothetical protein